MARILIVDDSPFILETLKIMLGQQGHEVVGEAVNSPEAQSKYQELKPDLVALDIMLPGESGLECLKKLRGIDPKARVFMVTAIGQRKVDQEAKELGALYVLHKPFDSQELNMAIDTVLNAKLDG